jgi:uncharacterized damage-inducible protein DinB
VAESFYYKWALHASVLYTGLQIYLKGVPMPPSLTSEQASFLLNAVFLPTLEREHPRTKGVLEAIPSTKGDYRPDQYSKTALELAWHIAVSEKRFLEAVLNGAFNFDPINRPDSVKTGAHIARWHEEAYQSLIGRLQKASGEQLVKTVDFRGMLQQPAVMYLQLAVNHSVHHRGQLSTYLRPMGGKVPAIYGESYDSAEARKAAEAKTA